MKALLASLFKRNAEPAPQVEPAPPKRRKLSAGKHRRPMPKGSFRINANGPIIGQARGKRRG